MLGLLLLLVMQVEFGSSPGPVEKVGSESAPLLFLVPFLMPQRQCTSGRNGLLSLPNTQVNNASADQLETPINCLAIKFFSFGE